MKRRFFGAAVLILVAARQPPRTGPVKQPLTKTANDGDPLSTPICEIKMDNDIVGQAYVATGAPSTVWVVSYEAGAETKVPHALLRKSGEPGTTKLIAVNALHDKRLYQKVEKANI